MRVERNRKREALKEVVIFFSVTIFLSFGIFWGPMAVLKIPTINLIEGKSGPIWAIVLFIIGGFVPSIVGILLTGIYEKKEEVKKLIKNSINYKFSIKWYLLIGVISLYHAVTLIILYETLGGKFNYTQFLIQLPSIIPLIILGNYIRSNIRRVRLERIRFEKAIKVCKCKSGKYNSGVSLVVMAFTFILYDWYITI